MCPCQTRPQTRKLRYNIRRLIINDKELGCRHTWAVGGHVSASLGVPVRLSDDLGWLLPVVGVGTGSLLPRAGLVRMRTLLPEMGLFAMSLTTMDDISEGRAS